MSKIEIETVERLSEATPPGGWEGWKRWMYNPPPSFAPVEIWSERCDFNGQIVIPCKTPPEWNVYSVYWRLAKPDQA